MDATVKAGSVMFTISEVEATVMNGSKSPWSAAAQDVALRLERTDAGRALQLTFENEKVAGNAIIGLRKAFKTMGKAVTLRRIGRHLYACNGNGGGKR